MDNEVEEENIPKKHKLIATTPDWLDLPDPIVTNIVLEHLDIVDYIRFSSVCKKWQSIQKQHRIRHSPDPPPSPLPFPWLSCIKCLYYYEEYTDITFYLPHHQKEYKIPLYKIPDNVNILGYGYGWLLLLLEFDKFHQSLCIWNPITGARIELSLFKSEFHAAYITSPPRDPCCTIVLLDYVNNIYLYRLNDNDNSIGSDCSISNKGRIFFCHNKIYCMVSCKKICVVDVLLPDPVEQMIEMDFSESCVDFDREMYLVDFLGDLIMVMVVYDEISSNDYDTIKEFHVYIADFSTNKWMRMKSLGDYVLFFSYGSIFLLPYVDGGCEKNTICVPGGVGDHEVAWRAFHLSRGNWIVGPSALVLKSKCGFYSNWVWFLPTLDCSNNNVAKTNGIQLK